MLYNLHLQYIWAFHSSKNRRKIGFYDFLDLNLLVCVKEISIKTSPLPSLSLMLLEVLVRMYARRKSVLTFRDGEQRDDCSSSKALGT